MEFTIEMIAKARRAADPEELLAMAKEEGIALTAEEAEQYFAFLQTGGDLSEMELAMVAGGKGKKDPDPKYRPGQHLWLGYHTTQNYLHVVVRQPEFYTKSEGWRYLVQPVGFEFLKNEYLETRKYVHDYDPGHWID